MQAHQIRSEAQFIVYDDVFHLQIVAELAISSNFATIEKKDWTISKWTDTQTIQMPGLGIQGDK